MKPVQAWEGTNGKLHSDPWSAAAEIIRCASERDIKAITDDPPPNPRVKEAIYWLADAARKNDEKLKKERKRLPRD